MAGPAQREGLMVDINVTPLVDVVLVLLVIMMVAATTLATRTIQIELPKARSGAQNPAAPLVISVDEGGALGVDGRTADDAAVRASARAAVSGNRDVTAVVAAHARARHEAVVRAIDLVRTERVAKIAIVVQEPR